MIQEGTQFVAASVISHNYNNQRIKRGRLKWKHEKTQGYNNSCRPRTLFTHSQNVLCRKEVTHVNTAGPNLLLVKTPVSSDSLSVRIPFMFTSSPLKCLWCFATSFLQFMIRALHLLGKGSEALSLKENDW